MTGPLFLDSSLPEELDAQVRSELRPGERLLWVGQPQVRRLVRQAIPTMLFGIPWTGFSVFWMSAASGMFFGNGGFGLFSLIFSLFGVPFVLIGLWLLTYPYWRWREAERTCYALTDRRAIVWQAGMFGAVTVRSYGPEALGRIHRTEYADGCGDVVFEQVTSQHGDSEDPPTETRQGFLAIPNVREVEELIRRVLLPASDGPTNV
jgi:hypothetical protein